MYKDYVFFLLCLAVLIFENKFSQQQPKLNFFDLKLMIFHLRINYTKSVTKHDNSNANTYYIMLNVDGKIIHHKLVSNL